MPPVLPPQGHSGEHIRRLQPFTQHSTAARAHVTYSGTNRFHKYRALQALVSSHFRHHGNAWGGGIRCRRSCWGCPRCRRSPAGLPPSATSSLHCRAGPPCAGVCCRSLPACIATGFLRSHIIPKAATLVKVALETASLVQRTNTFCIMLPWKACSHWLIRPREAAFMSRLSPCFQIACFGRNCHAPPEHHRFAQNRFWTSASG